MEYILNEAKWHTKQLHCRVLELMLMVSLSVKEKGEGATGYWSRESQQRGVTYGFTIGEEAPIEGDRLPRLRPGRTVVPRSWSERRR